MLRVPAVTEPKRYDNPTQPRPTLVATGVIIDSPLMPNKGGKEFRAYCFQ